MATEMEVRVMEILSAIEIEPDEAARAIEKWGNEAVTVVCEAALGQYPETRPKVRMNAVALLGWIEHPQADETIELLVNDSNPDVAIRAIRSVGRKKNDRLVGLLAEQLQRPATPPLIAAEATRALIAIDSGTARAAVEEYEKVAPDKLSHRGAKAVQEQLLRRRR